MKHLICFALLCASLGAAPVKLTLFPQSVTLNSKESRQQLLAEASVDGLSEDWTRKAEWTSSNPAIAEVDAAGMLTPKADGDVTISAKSMDSVATLKVSVKNTKGAFTWGFVGISVLCLIGVVLSVILARMRKRALAARTQEKV